MKNVTITVKERVAQWARVEAARRGTSVSRMVGDMLEEKMRQDQAYASAMESFLAREPQVLSADGDYPTRDDLHER